MRLIRPAATALGVVIVFIGAMSLRPDGLAAQAPRPNIVLIFPDNLGWGEVGAYGSVRGR